MSLSNPAAVIARLEEIEADLAGRQREYEEAAQAHFVRKREKEKQRAEAFLAAEGTVAERTAIADRETATVGCVEEASYEAQKSVVKVLEARATIGAAILKAQGRGA